jgi:hypothetical protein
LARRTIIALPAGFTAFHGLAVPVQAAPPAPAHTDSVLLALCRRFMSLERRLFRISSAMIDASEARDRPREDELQNVYRRFIPYSHQLMAEIMDLRATTSDGVRAKAEVICTRINYSSEGGPLGESFPIWSLCRDLLGYEPTESVA